jgi:sulfide dehydrogenase cytochrome subunit
MRKYWLRAALIALTLSFAACSEVEPPLTTESGTSLNEDDASLNEDDASSATAFASEETNIVALMTPSAGRLLAAQCAQCHGTDGLSRSGIEGLAHEAGEIPEEMAEMRSSSFTNDIMHQQARGYTAAEVQAIADWFASHSSGTAGDDDDDDERYENDDDDERYENDDDDKRYENDDDEHYENDDDDDDD